MGYIVQLYYLQKKLKIKKKWNQMDLCLIPLQLKGELTAIKSSTFICSSTFFFA